MHGARHEVLPSHGTLGDAGPPLAQIWGWPSPGMQRRPPARGAADDRGAAGQRAPRWSLWRTGCGRRRASWSISSVPDRGPWCMARSKNRSGPNSADTGRKASEFGAYFDQHRPSTVKFGQESTDFLISTKIGPTKLGPTSSKLDRIWLGIGRTWADFYRTQDELVRVRGKLGRTRQTSSRS